MQIMLDFDSMVRFRSKVTNENCLNRNLKLKVNENRENFFHPKVCKLTGKCLFACQQHWC